MHRACRAAGRTAAEQEGSAVPSTAAAFGQARTPFATFATFDRSSPGRPAPAEGVN